MARQSGDFFDRKFVARGSAIIDFNNDGNPDIVVCVINDTPHLLRNEGIGSNWLKVVPRRKDSGAIALGSVVTVKANGLTMIQPVMGVNGYASSGDPRPNFGLGNAKEAESVEILWPDGEKQILGHVPAGQIVQIRQGEAK
jgi:hypothetical protein